MKIAVCACVHLENLYLREWVEHYINIGFDKIILYDTNTKDGEYPQTVVQDYVDKGFVDIINKRPDREIVNFSSVVQMKLYNECLDTYGKKYDWIAFFDVDEFLFIKDYKDIHKVFEVYKYTAEQINVCMADVISEDILLYYENKPVQERFTKVIYKNNDCGIKSIVSSNVKKYYTKQPHQVYNRTSCFPNNIPISWPNDSCYKVNFTSYDVMYLKHYQYKSLQEYFNRRLRSAQQKFNHINIYKNRVGWSDECERLYQEFIKYKNSQE